MKLLSLHNRKQIKMNAPEIRLELHKIIDQIKDSQLLEAVYTLLTSQRKIAAYTTDGKPLTKEVMDAMLEASESDIKSGRLTNHRIVKEEIQSWRRK